MLIIRRNTLIIDINCYKFTYLDNEIVSTIQVPTDRLSIVWQKSPQMQILANNQGTCDTKELIHIKVTNLGSTCD